MRGRGFKSHHSGYGDVVELVTRTVMTQKQRVTGRLIGLADQGATEVVALRGRQLGRPSSGRA